MPTKNQKTTRNIIIGLFALFFLLPKRSSAITTTTNQPGENGYTPTSGTNGSKNESYLGITPTSINRGIRNNNPGNIKFYESNNWLGKIPIQNNTDALDQDGEPTFEQFEKWRYGIRAMIYLIKNRYLNEGFNTLKLILNKYDPGYNQNYLNFLSTYVGMPDNQLIQPSDESTTKKIIMAIAKFENGSAGTGQPDIITSSAYDTARNIL